MRLEKYDFQWFEKEDNRKALRASVSLNGKLRLGGPLRQELPEYIKVGFDAKQRILAIADGYGSGIGLSKTGMLTAELLAAQITASGLKLPVRFKFSYDKTTGYWLGRVIPKRRRTPDGMQYDVEQLLMLYQHIIGSAVQQLAKTTPTPERKAFAVEAFCAAVQEYRTGYGDLESYISSQVEKKLRTENKQFTAAYTVRSLDAPLKQEHGDNFCLYDMLTNSSDGGIGALEARILEEQFMENLAKNELKLLKLMMAGCTVAQISAELGVDEDEILRLGEAIGKKRKCFYEVA